MYYDFEEKVILTCVFMGFLGVFLLGLGVFIFGVASISKESPKDTQPKYKVAIPYKYEEDCSCTKL